MAGKDAPVTGALADGPLGGQVKADAQRVMDEERSDVVAYQVEGGEALVLHEFLPRPIQLLLCGEGNDVEPLARLGAELGWQVVTAGKDAALPATDDRTAAVVMTHNYARDLALLGQLLPSRAGYVGLLGPKSRTERLLKDVERHGAAPNVVALQRLHAPVGLDIGAETPEEVALAIAAEIRAQMAGRGGGKLKERKGPIHERR
jgi:xanthine/CO dehydrogenase XdhC/CoxF family maturation factor